jgi:hypothetical protein
MQDLTPELAAVAEALAVDEELLLRTIACALLAEELAGD